MPFSNVYENATRAEAYSKLGFANTYYLAFRDLPELFRRYVHGRHALDFGCGTGRSTRFLQQSGFEATGVDISPDMLRKAHEIDPDGDYRLIPGDDFSELPKRHYALILSAFTFDNIPGRDAKIRIFGDLRELLAPDGVLVNIVSSPEIYVNEWASFSTKDYPENRQAKTGDTVKIITTDFEDSSPAIDILWAHENYLEVYREAGLEVLERLKPLADGSEPYAWVSERRIAPWAIYVLKSA